MGYETRLYIIEERNTHVDAFVAVAGNWGQIFNYENKKDKEFLKNREVVFAEYASPIVTINLAKCSDVFHNYLHNKNINQQHYIYHSDGDTVKITDSYGDKLMTFKANTVLEALKVASADSEHRRYRTAIATIESMLPDYNNLMIITEGY